MSLTENTCALGAAKRSILPNVLLKLQGALRSGLKDKTLKKAPSSPKQRRIR